MRMRVTVGGGDIGKNELTLRPLTWIEQETLLVPAQEIGTMIAAARGLLTGRT